MLTEVTEGRKLSPASKQDKQEDYKCIRIQFWEWLICCLGGGNDWWIYA